MIVLLKFWESSLQDIEKTKKLHRCLLTHEEHMDTHYQNANMQHAHSLGNSHYLHNDNASIMFLINLLAKSSWSDL